MIFNMVLVWGPMVVLQVDNTNGHCAGGITLLRNLRHQEKGELELFDP
jgi:hypothetical protein